MPEDLDTIREDTWSVETPSLDQLGMEPVPAEIVRDVLRKEWHDNPQCPRPEIHVLNDIDFAPSVNLRGRDYLIIDVGPQKEEQRGFTYQYKDIEIPVTLSIHTVDSRQRLYNLKYEASRIIYKNNRTMRPYQLIYWDEFVEDSDGKNRYWTGDATIRLTSQGVPVFKGVVAGMGSENLPPDQR